MKKILILLILLIPFNIQADEINISSKNAILLNLTTNEFLYEKNKDEIVKVASLQKIMTTLIAIENIDDYNKKVKIDLNEFNSLDKDLAIIGFNNGDEVTYDDLLYGTLLRSGADAAYKLALEVGGSEEEFVNLMNKKVKELGLKNTNFKNCTGLDEENQFSTAYDMSIILKYALLNEKFKEIITTKEYNINSLGILLKGPKNRAKSLEMPYFMGGKTGYTNGAGLCLASYAIIDNVEFILITLGADYNLKNQNYIDQKNIYDYYKNNYSYRTILKKGTYISTIKSNFYKNIDLFADKDIKLYINNKIMDEDIYIKYSGIEKINKKIKFNEKIGTYYVMYKDKVLYKSDIYLKENIIYNFEWYYLIFILLFLIIFGKIIRIKKRT